MIWSVSASGNFRGSLVVSMSNARTTGSCGKETESKVTAREATKNILDVMRVRKSVRVVPPGRLCGLSQEGTRCPGIERCTSGPEERTDSNQKTIENTQQTRQ